MTGLSVHCDDDVYADTSACPVFAGVGESGLQKITAESGTEIAEVFSMLTNPRHAPVFALVSAFFVMTVLASAGGALGSKVLIKNSREAALCEPPTHGMTLFGGEN